MTFLDPYLETSQIPLFNPAKYKGEKLLGGVSDWSDNYISSIVGGVLDQAYNVDVRYLEQLITWRWSAHGFATEFYFGTITNSSNPIYEGRGFALSREGGNWDFATNVYHKGDYYPLV